MKEPKYVSKKPDASGYVPYTAEEHHIWSELFHRQIKIVETRACAEYLQGISDLELTDVIPQIPDVNERLRKLTGWEIASVPALINYERFFKLLSERKFPCATFIRTREDMDYIQEPDVFHEIFGHCPLLTLPVYADFMQAYGEISYQADPKNYAMLARLYWFTVEFGLIQTQNDLRIYGGGILSSKGETTYALESNQAIRKPLDIIDAFRTPYRIDILQPIYFVIQDFKELYNLVQKDLIGSITKARELGMHAPLFPPKVNSEDKLHAESGYRTC
jgi:phenylalanine-4-hydroxylase